MSFILKSSNLNMSENLRQNGEMLPVFKKNFTSVLEYFSTIGLYSIAGYPNFAQ